MLGGIIVIEINIEKPVDCEECHKQKLVEVGQFLYLCSDYKNLIGSCPLMEEVYKSHSKADNCPLKEATK